MTLAVFLPTPSSIRSSSIVDGTSPPKRSPRVWEAATTAWGDLPPAGARGGERLAGRQADGCGHASMLPGRGGVRQNEQGSPGRTGNNAYHDTARRGRPGAAGDGGDRPARHPAGR